MLFFKQNDARLNVMSYVAVVKLAQHQTTTIKNVYLANYIKKIYI